MARVSHGAISVLNIHDMLACTSLQKLSPGPITRRYASSAAKRRKQGPPLPREKLRALISLYHQTEHFITPEELSSKIDEEFVDPHIKDTRLVPTLKMATYKQLTNALHDRRAKPKFSDWHKPPTSLGLDVGGTWSDIHNVRETKVMEALYGVVDGGRANLPGLEVLEESTETLRQKIQEDMGEEDSDPLPKTP